MKTNTYYLIFYFISTSLNQEGQIMALTKKKNSKNISKSDHKIIDAVLGL